MKRTKTKLWLSRDQWNNYCLWHRKPKLDEEGDFKPDTFAEPIIDDLCPLKIHKIFGIKLKNKETIPVELIITIKKSS